MDALVLDMLEANLRLTEGFVRVHARAITLAARMLAERLAAGNKILVFGNGGSAADAQHIAAEFINRFAFDRAPLAAIALTTDTSVLTSIANDYDFIQVFARQVKALGRSGDVAWGISTSGRSPNVAAGLAAAREAGLATLASTGRGGGPVGALADTLFAVDSEDTPRIQECHLFLAHALCSLTERILFPEVIA
jgi:D-sedoheptulose 7-phosphate isomerase